MVAVEVVVLVLEASKGTIITTCTKSQRLRPLLQVNRRDRSRPRRDLIRVTWTGTSPTSAAVGPNPSGLIVDRFELVGLRPSHGMGEPLPKNQLPSLPSASTT